jgi:hypothetical protein
MKNYVLFVVHFNFILFKLILPEKFKSNDEEYINTSNCNKININNKEFNWLTLSIVVLDWIKPVAA